MGSGQQAVVWKRQDEKVNLCVYLCLLKPGARGPSVTSKPRDLQEEKIKDKDADCSP